MSNYKLCSYDDLYVSKDGKDTFTEQQLKQEINMLYVGKVVDKKGKELDVDLMIKKVNNSKNGFFDFFIKDKDSGEVYEISIINVDF